MTCANAVQPLGLKFGNFTVRTGIDVRGIGLWVGTPTQLISMRPSTNDDETWVQNSADCDGPNDLYCVGNWGGVYNYSTSSTFSLSSKSTWNGTGVAETSSDPPDTYIYFNDRIQFGSNGSISGYPLVTRKKGYATGDGLGISSNSTFLDLAVKSGAAPSRDWGLWVGSRSVQQPVDGSFWIGGYDTNRVSSDFTIFNAPVNCEFCVQITDMTYQYSGGSQSLFSNSSQALTVSLDPYSRYLEVPSDIYGNLIRVTQAQGAFVSNIGAATFNRSASMGNLSVTLNNGYKTVIPSWELFMPRQTVNANTGALEIVDGAPLTTQFYNQTYEGFAFNWGMPYLTQNYLVTDFANNKFKMAPARQGGFTQSNGALIAPLCSGIAASTATAGNPSGTATSSSTSAANTTSPSSSTNVGAIAGGVVGGVVGLALLAALVWFILRGKKREKALKEERDAALAGGSEAGNTHEVMSQTATDPTVTSSVYGGGKAYQYDKSVNGWLQQNTASNVPQPYPHAYSTTQPPSEVPNSPHHPPTQLSPQSPSEATFTASAHSQAQAGHPTSPTSATVNEPFEMPAYQYR